MATTYLSGNRIQGLSTDTKPTNVPLDSRFEETDTKKIYYFSSNGAPTYANAEDSGSWSTDGSLSIGEGKLKIRLGGSENGRAKRSISVNSSQWIMRFKWDQNGTQTLSAPHDMRCIIGLSSTNTSFNSGTQNCVGMYLDVGHVHLVGVVGASAPATQPTASSLLNFDTANSEQPFTRYIEIIRNGDLFTLNIFTSSSFTGSPITSSKTIAGITSLSHIGGTAGWFGGGGGINGDITEIAFYDGVTTIAPAFALVN